MEIKVDVEVLKKRPLMIGTPAYGGQVSTPYHISSINLANQFNSMNIPLRSCIIENESLITRARNNIAKMFTTTDEFTHLLFIDADIRFGVEDVLSLLALADEDHEIIAGSYPKKSIDWDSIEKAVKIGVPASELKNYIANPVLNLVPTESGTQRIDLAKPIEVLDTGTGFMMIRKSVFEKMAKAYPELLYTPDYALSNPAFDSVRNEGVYAFFDTMITLDETSVQKKAAGIKRYLSEDYAFCYLWRKIGGKIWVCPWINLTHHGTYHYQGNLQAIYTMNARLSQMEAERTKKMFGGMQ